MLCGEAYATTQAQILTKPIKGLVLVSCYISRLQSLLRAKPAKAGHFIQRLVILKLPGNSRPIVCEKHSIAKETV